MQREEAWFKGKAIETFFVQNLAFYQDSIGKVRLSRETAHRAMDLAKKFDLTETPATIISTQAVRDALHGFTGSARQKAAPPSNSRAT
jgi:hypothetical protein